MSRLKSAAVAACVLLGALAAPAAAARPLQLPTDQPLLFALQADRGSLIRARRSRDRYVLTLRGLPAQGIWFTDRPERDSGDMRLDRFFATWRRLGFDHVAPNAVVTLTGGRRNANAVALTLGRPRYDRRADAVRFPARPLRRLSASLAHLRDDVDRRIPRRFGTASVFIDDAKVIDYGGSREGCGYVGEVALYPVTAPRARTYLPADGRRLPIGDNTALYSLVYDAFGSDHQTYFGLPDLTAPAGLRYDLCAQGWFPLRGDSDTHEQDGYGARCTNGTLSLQAQQFRATGWLPADGRLLRMDRETELFDAIGARFGGDGETTFALPRVESAPPGLAWYVCTRGLAWQEGEKTRDWCTLGEITLFANRSLPANYLPADGRRVRRYDRSALYHLLDGPDSWDRDAAVPLPDVPAPTPGTTYGFCSDGVWPS